MKKTLLTTGLIAFAFGAFAQFTAGSLVVSQVGDGSAPLRADTSAVMILRQFPLTGGASTYTLTMPIAPNGTNKALTGKGKSTIEGLLTLSPNGLFLTAVGYDIAPGKLIDSALKSKRVYGLITGDGTINTTTALTTTSNNLVDPRIAITLDGTGFWATFNGNGVRYFDIGATTTTAVQSNPLNNARSVNIFNNQLYYTTNSSTGPHVGTISGAANGTFTQTNLPKNTNGGNTNTAPVALPGTQDALGNDLISVPNQVVFLKTTTGEGEPDIFYAANNDTGAQKIEKWVFNNVSSKWEAKGTVAIDEATQGILRGITGRIVNGTAQIYVNTETQILSITDPLALTSIITDADNGLTVLATAPVNTLFKGIALSPGTTVLPIKLSSFTGKSELNGVQLSWTIASEKNNNRFEVLSSTDGQSFNKIGKVAGSGNSDASLSYSYLDRNAVKGANYYKLNQVDGDGKSEEFGPVVITVNGQPADLSVYANKANGAIKVNIHANNNGNATLNIYDANGRVVATQYVSLNAGNNEVSLSSQSAGMGLHIASLIVDGVTLTKKFIFQ